MTSLAARLLDHAAHVMPPSRREWVRGMRAELAHIPTPVAAAAFALGCVRASYMQRIQDMLTLIRLGRWALAGYAVVCAGCYLLVALLYGHVKTTPGISPQDLGSDPGTAQSLSFAQGYPAWQLAAFVLISALLAVGAVQLVRRRSSALVVIAPSVAVAALISVLDLRLPGAADWPLAWSSAWVIPLLSLGPVWWLSRHAPDLRSA